MFLLSLTATCQVCTVSLKAGQSTYNCLAADCLQPTLRSGLRQLLKAGVRCQFQPKSREGFGPPTAPQSVAGSNERTCTMSGALLQSRFQVEERLAQLLVHLGLDQ